MIQAVRNKEQEQSEGFSLGYLYEILMYKGYSVGSLYVTASPTEFYQQPCMEQYKWGPIRHRMIQAVRNTSQEQSEEFSLGYLYENEEGGVRLHVLPVAVPRTRTHKHLGN